MEHTCNSHPWDDDTRVSEVWPTWVKQTETIQQTNKQTARKSAHLSKTERAHIYHLINSALQLLDIILDKNNSNPRCSVLRLLTFIFSSTLEGNLKRIYAPTLIKDDV